MDWKKTRLIRSDDYKVFKVETAAFSYQNAESTFYQIKAPDWVNVICEVDDTIIMIRQFRIGIEDYTLELPGGLVDAGELALDTGIRELAEETGYSGSACMIGTMHPNPALFTNKLSTVLIRHAQQTEQISREIFEDIEIVRISLQEIKRKIAHGEITNALTLASLMQYFSMA